MKLLLPNFQAKLSIKTTATALQDGALFTNGL